ncbi:sensor histidine kinase [Actinophytocola xanthii]|uniref:histidine kinase n=1 Tax=Actinophytocola xanthii TaxID=1912961 RepID=A0A1Q8CT10_9PSEU|nr:sensor histidine kinase [Actinophytocola xanthii]OLF17480.1 hypothetical protein BU204_11095 [Actinophytocola xanthii]
MGSWRGRWVDGLVVAATALFVIGSTLASAARGGGSMTLLGWTLLTTACGVLAWRRRYPVAVLCTTLLACALYYPLTGPGSPVLLTFVVALFSAAAQGRMAFSTGAAVVAMALTLVGEFAGSRRHLDDIALFMLTGWLVAVLAVGFVVHHRKAFLREAEQRAVAAERGREALASQRATEERLRIARELHDVLGHNISLINVQASAALHRLDRDGADEQRSALAAIKDSSHQALRELRATLGVLRQADERAPLVVPGLAALDELLDGARSTGLAVRSEVAGDPAGVPPRVDLAAYRIVQEALTNVCRHARAASAVVRIRYTEREVRVEVDDDGPGDGLGDGLGDGEGGEPDAGDGSGIRGMRERARALGGSLTVGSRAGGGFRVRALLPFEAA